MKKIFLSAVLSAALITGIGGIAAYAEETANATTTTSTEKTQVKSVGSAWIVYREKGSTKLWAVTKEKQKREIQTLSFFSFQDVEFGIKLVESGRLSELTEGAPITSTEGLNAEDFRKFPVACKLIKIQGSPAVYLLCGSERRVILNEKAFSKNGWSFKDVKTVATADISTTTEGEPVGEQTTLDSDVSVEASTTTEAPKSTNETKPTDKEALRRKLEARLQALGKDENKKRIVKPEGYAQLYVIDTDGVKHKIVSMKAVSANKLDLKNTSVAPAAEVFSLEEGEPITEDTTANTVIEEEFEIE